MTYRDLFHQPEGTYLLSHSVGLLPKEASDVLDQAYLQPWRTKGGDAWPQWLGLIDDFRTELGGLLGGDASCFCPQGNLSSALVKYLMSLPRRSECVRVLMHPNAFPSMGFAVEALKDQGFALEFLPKGSDPCSLDAWDTALDAKPHVALITHVHSNTGALSPVGEITALCRSKGILSVVDIAQSAGLVPIDLDTWNADMVMGSCVKWLCGGPGAGFMWINPNQLGSLEPSDVGWFSHENPFEFDISSFRYAADALRFWGGTPSVAPYATALGSLRTLKRIGAQTLWQHNRTLLRQAIDMLPQVVTADIDLERNGGTLCLKIPSGTIDTVLQTLDAEQVRIDSRGTTIRASFHIFNDAQDVEALAYGISQALSHAKDPALSA